MLQQINNKEDQKPSSIRNGGNPNENPKFDTNQMRPYRFMAKWQTTTKLYTKVHQNDGLGMMEYGHWQPCM